MLPLLASCCRSRLLACKVVCSPIAAAFSLFVYQLQTLGRPELLIATCESVPYSNG